MGISSNPTNTNLSQPSKFSLTFDRLPYLTYFCKRVNIPGIAFGSAAQPNPFIDAPIPGDKMVYGTLDVTFLIDEPLYAWTTVQDWIKGMSFPDSFDQYKNLNLQQKLQLRGAKPQYSDAILTILTNKNNPVVTVQFKDVFPVSIGSLDYDTSLSATSIIYGTVSFKFTNYEISRV
jgi:hypothetical protein